MLSHLRSLWITGGLRLWRYTNPFRICLHQRFTARMLTLLCFNLYLSQGFESSTDQLNSSQLLRQDVKQTSRQESLLNKQNLLSEGARGEHLGDKVDVPVGSVNPRSIELHYVGVFQGLEKVNLTGEPLKFLGALQEIMKLHLIPCYFNPLILIKGSVSATRKSSK